MDSYKILVADDEQNIRDIVEAYLLKEDYEVFTAKNGKEAIDIFKGEDIDLLVLDLMMPIIDGIDVCNYIRQSSDIPIIMLTARVEEEDIIKGIKQGADDYMKKPFSARELMVRIEALLRRTRKDKPMLDVYTFGHQDLVVNQKSMVVMKKQKPVTLTPNEFKILVTFIQNPNMVLSRNQIIEKSFGIDFDGFDRTIDTHIKNLRLKLEDDPKNPKYIKTIYSMGYKFITDEIGG